MSEIKLLKKEIYELIAAGEVIDKPAAIVKELLENSIDAGASVITVEIKNGGKSYIRVTDNGKGISPEDVPTAFLRHATSKIAVKKDLDSIMTLGFRGEALASICAVAKVEVLTKLIDEDFGTHYVIEGGEEKCNEQSGCPDGTTFVVRDIFYNVPARLKFLKKDSSEANYIADIVTKLTVSHPEISIKFIRDNKPEILSAGDGKTYSAIYSVFGKDFANSLLPVDYTWQGIHIGGYTVKPLMSKPNRKYQHFFVNHRYVKSKACSSALEEAYRNQIMTGKFPACVLYIDISPDTIDVNVHPTKTEVRFSDEKLMHEAVYFAVNDALIKNDKPNKMQLGSDLESVGVKKNFGVKELYVPPKVDTGIQLEFVQPENTEFDSKPEETIVYNDDLFLSQLDEDINSRQELRNSIIDSVERHLEEHKPEPQNFYSDEDTDIGADSYKYLSTSSFEKKEEPAITEHHEEKPKPIVIGELFKTYVIAQAGDEMILMDKHAAHERYIFEQIKNNKKNLEPQMLLEPIMVTLSFDEYDIICENIEKMRSLGFEVEPDTAPTIAIKGIPVVLADTDPTELIEEMAKNLLDNKLDPQLEFFDDLYHSMACKAAIKANDISDKHELQVLLDNVYDNDDIRYCPHGRPVMIILSKKDVEKQFKRIV